MASSGCCHVGRVESSLLVTRDPRPSVLEVKNKYSYKSYLRNLITFEGKNTSTRELFYFDTYIYDTFAIFILLAS